MKSIAVVATVDEVVFKQDDNRHTVYQAKIGKAIEAQSDWSGNIKAVMASTLDEAVEKLRAQLEVWLSGRVQFGDPGPADYKFSVRYEVVSADGLFWGKFFSICPCAEYEVAAKAAVVVN